MSFSLQEDRFQGTTTLIDRKIWTQRANTEAPDTAVIFLDAELYIDRVHAPTMMQQEGPHALAVYVSNKDAVARHIDYTCKPTYARFIAEDVLPWVLKRHPTLNPTRIMLAGLSLSGLAAADIALRYPDRFSHVICQSPSFWWENERFRTQIPQYTQKSPAFWICVGDQETQSGVSHPPTGLRQNSTQIEACEHTRDALIEAGYTVSYRTYPRGHDPACWKDDLALALRWITSATGSATAVSRVADY
jgi:enterochelin esterase-like enzyme